MKTETTKEIERRHFSTAGDAYNCQQADGGWAISFDGKFMVVDDNFLLYLLAAKRKVYHIRKNDGRIVTVQVSQEE